MNHNTRFATAETRLLDVSQNGPLQDQSEFDAVAHGVDAFGANANAVAKFPGKWRESLAAAPAVFAAGYGNQGVFAFAMHHAGPGRFFERADRQESFDEDLQQLDKAAVFLYGNDERFVLITEMIFHELRGLPVF